MPLYRLTCSKGLARITISNIFITKLRHKTTYKDLQRVWTIPNVISACRIVSCPLLSYSLLSDRPVTSLILLTALGATDWLDGWLARRWRQQTALGSMLDPLGDKVLIGTLAGTLFWMELLPGWLLLIMLGRDLGLVSAGILVRYFTLPPPRNFWRFFDTKVATTTVTPTLISKINTALQLLLVALTIGIPIAQNHLEDGSAVNLLVNQLLPPMQYIVAGTTLWSSVIYATKYKQVIKFLRTKNK